MIINEDRCHFYKSIRLFPKKREFQRMDSVKADKL